jgi:hypothetical protein
MRLSRWLSVLGVAVLVLSTLRARPVFAQRPRACGFWNRDYATRWYWSASNSQPPMLAPVGSRTSFYSAEGQSVAIRVGTRAVQREEASRRVLPLSEMGNQNFPDQRH